MTALRNSRSDGCCTGYCQAFRSGRIESVGADITSPGDGFQFIPSQTVEGYVIQAVDRYLEAFKAWQIPCPVVVIMSVIRAKGVYLGVSFRHQRGERVPIDRDILILPDVLFEDYENNIARTLRPVFDAMWNAAGFPGSSTYDENGDWKPGG